MLRRFISKVKEGQSYSQCFWILKRLKHTKSLEPVIGLEIHAQIASESKLFSGAPSAYGGPINSQVAYFDASLPGTLPVLNQKCVKAGVKTALALSCTLNKMSLFDRKHYFYADLPAGYQITQQRKPLAHSGHLSYYVMNRGQFTRHKARIIQLQLEQDSGKSLHDEEAGYSLIDLNRAGVALMEIVTEPDFHSGEEAAAFVRELIQILNTLGTCDCKMEEGSLRVDASISLHYPGEPLGTRAEVKNINSVRYVAQAIAYEIQRQKAILEKGDTVVNETRSFNYQEKKTVSMRDKERLHDYRFMPEPNLPPLHLYDKNNPPPAGVHSNQVIDIDEIKCALPELPDVKRSRLIEEYGLRIDQAVVIVNEPGLFDYFYAVSNEFNNQASDEQVPPQSIANFLINVVMATVHKNDPSFIECKLSAHQIADVLRLRNADTITSAGVRQVLDVLYNSSENQSALTVVENNNLFAIKDIEQLNSLINAVFAENKKLVRKASKGKERAFTDLFHKIQNQCEQRAHNVLLDQLMKEKLSDITLDK